MRIGLFGGTFDPPHLGHLEVARAAQQQLQLDEVIWVPAAKNPMKQSAIVTQGFKRLKMVQMTIAAEPGMSTSDIELTRGGLSYTIDTLTEFQILRPAEYWLILGSDSLDGIYTWKQPERLAKACRIACILRSPHDQEEALRHVPDFIKPLVDFVEMPPAKVSSTMVRDCAMREIEFDQFVHPDVNQFILENGLYA